MADRCCSVGAAPGHWGGDGALSWTLHAAGPCLHEEILPFVSIRDVCLRRGGPADVKNCAVANRTLMNQLQDASILMLGDSTAAQLLGDACSAFGSPMQPFIQPPKVLSNISLYHHRLRSLDQHVCFLLQGKKRQKAVLEARWRAARTHGSPSEEFGSLPFASFSHYGIGRSPNKHWAFAYPLAPWLGKNAFQQVQENLPAIRGFTRSQDPKLIVVGSDFWDIAGWWQHDGNFSKGFQITERHMHLYVQGVTDLVKTLRDTFPHSQLVWRLMHPGSKHSITPTIVHHLNQAVRAHLSNDMHVPILDVENMLLQLSPRDFFPRSYTPQYGTNDGRHLWPLLNLQVLNIILNLALRALHGPLCA